MSRHQEPGPSLDLRANMSPDGCLMFFRRSLNDFEFQPANVKALRRSNRSTIPRAVIVTSAASVPDHVGVVSTKSWELHVQMGESMTKPIPAALHHTCFLVRDLEGTAQRLADALGIGPWNIWTITPAECKVRGQVSPFSFRVALATVGGGTFELITPHSGRSIYEEHLEKDGESSITPVSSTQVWRRCARPRPSSGDRDASWFRRPAVGTCSILRTSASRRSARLSRFCTSTRRNCRRPKGSFALRLSRPWAVSRYAASLAGSS